MDFSVILKSVGLTSPSLGGYLDILSVVNNRPIRVYYVSLPKSSGGNPWYCGFHMSWCIAGGSCYFRRPMCPTLQALDRSSDFVGIFVWCGSKLAGSSLATRCGWRRKTRRSTRYQSYPLKNHQSIDWMWELIEISMRNVDLHLYFGTLQCCLALIFMYFRTSSHVLSS